MSSHRCTFKKNKNHVQSHMINQYLNVFLMFHLYSNYIPVQNFIIELVFFLFCMLNVAGSEPRYDPFVKCQATSKELKYCGISWIRIQTLAYPINNYRCSARSRQSLRAGYPANIQCPVHTWKTCSSIKSASVDGMCLTFLRIWS